MATIEEILASLVSFQSITPLDAGCQDFMITFLEQLGFRCQRLDNSPVSNFFARIGDKPPLLVFAGHTDVVPVGNTLQWQSDPFKLTARDGLLYGRGTADMKGSLAAMLVMASQFVKNHASFNGSLGFLITSGEEGDLYLQGTPYVMQELAHQNIAIDYCIVGEPSSTRELGDVIKIGRRGSLNGKITVFGKQGHVAYPHLAENPIHTVSPALYELTTMHWDEGNNHFPPTTLQVTHIHAGGGANNIIPGELVIDINFRFSTEQTPHSLQQAVVDCFNRHDLNPTIDWTLSGLPFLTEKGKLLSVTTKAITDITGKSPSYSTSGGTSDGRFIAPFGVDVIELGPVHESIHQVNEHVSLEGLKRLSDIYYAITHQLLCDAN